MAADGGPAQLGQPEHAVIHASMVPMYVCRLVNNFKITLKNTASQGSLSGKDFGRLGSLIHFDSASDIGDVAKSVYLRLIVYLVLIVYSTLIVYSNLIVYLVLYL